MGAKQCITEILVECWYKIKVIGTVFKTKLDVSFKKQISW